MPKSPGPQLPGLNLLSVCQLSVEALGIGARFLMPVA
jgi:hypothetical protein